MGLPAMSQYYFYNDEYYESALTWEAGLSAGGMNCLTDLGGRKGAGKKFIKDINWNATRPCGGVYAGINYLDIVAGTLSIYFVPLKASDLV
jgi:hypothetical protein